MKQGIHPDYREVVFSDEDAGFAFLTRSTIKTNETIQWEDGNEYPLVKLEISSASHPFFTGKQKLVDSTVESKGLSKGTDQQVPDKHQNKKLLLKKKNNFTNSNFLCLNKILHMVAKQ